MPKGDIYYQPDITSLFLLQIRDMIQRVALTYIYSGYVIVLLLSFSGGPTSVTYVCRVFTILGELSAPTESQQHLWIWMAVTHVYHSSRARARVCVCVCVCVRERERYGVNSIWSIPHQIDRFQFNSKFINSNSIFTDFLTYSLLP